MMKLFPFALLLTLFVAAPRAVGQCVKDRETGTEQAPADGFPFKKEGPSTPFPPSPGTPTLEDSVPSTPAPGHGVWIPTGSAIQVFPVYSDFLIRYSSFDLDNDRSNPANGGRGFSQVGPPDSCGQGVEPHIPGKEDPPVPQPPAPDTSTALPSGFARPGPCNCKFYTWAHNPSLQKNPQQRAATFGTGLFAYDYSSVDSTERLTLDWVDDGNGNAVRRLFVFDDATGITFEFEDYASSSTIYGARWRMIRSYFGTYSSPDWQRLFIYDSTAGHGGLIESVDVRGIRTFYDWTNLGTTQVPIWRITKLRMDEPSGGTWASYDWTQLDTTLEYDTAGYLIAIVRKPRLVRHDVTNKVGDGSLNAQGDWIAPTIRFQYSSDTTKYPLNLPLVSVYEDLNGGGTDATFSDCRKLVNYAYGVDVDRFRVVQKLTGPDRLNAYALDTFTYDHSASISTWTNPAGTVKAYTHERDIVKSCG